MTPNKPIILTLLILSSISLGYYLWDKASVPVAAAKSRAPVQVEVDQVALATARRTIRAIGTMVAAESVILKPEIDGRIQSIGFDSGQQVTRQQILVRFDDELLQAELAAAEAALAYSEAQYDRAAQLLKSGTGNQRNRDEAQSQRDIDRARLALARRRLERAVIAAPFAGQVGLRTISQGDFVKAGEEMATLDQLDPIRVQFSIAEKYLPFLKIGMAVKLTSDAYPDRIFSARLSAVSPRIDPQTRLVSVEAQMANADNTLKPGQFVSVQWRIQERENALFIPENALVQNGAERFVMVVGADNVVVRTPVKTGLRLANQLEVLEGLTADQRIITAGQQKTQPGQVIVPLPPSPVTNTPDAEEVEIVKAGIPSK